MCLAQFAATFTTARRDSPEGLEDHIPNPLADSDDEESEESNIIRLRNGLGMMRKRQKHCIIRFHREKSEGEEKYRNLLMFYLPWRCEDRYPWTVSLFQSQIQPCEGRGTCK